MSWLSEFAGGGGLGFLPSLLFDGNKGGGGGGSKRDGAPQPLPSVNANLNPPANYWQGNQFMIPGAPQNQAPSMPGAPSNPASAAPPGGIDWQKILSGLGGGLGGLSQQLKPQPQQQGPMSQFQPAPGGMAGALGGGGAQAMPQAGGMAGVMANNPGIQALIARLRGGGGGY